jgi:hypothetical protein
VPASSHRGAGGGCDASGGGGVVGVVMHQNQWQILDINHDENMVVLVSSTTPTVKRYAVPNRIEWAKVNEEHLRVYCEALVAWELKIADGAR